MKAFSDQDISCNDSHVIGEIHLKRFPPQNPFVGYIFAFFFFFPKNTFLDKKFNFMHAH